MINQNFWKTDFNCPKSKLLKKCKVNLSKVYQHSLNWYILNVHNNITVCLFLIYAVHVQHFISQKSFIHLGISQRLKTFVNLRFWNKYRTWKCQKLILIYF